MVAEETTMEDIRREIEALVEGDVLDKATSLTITRLFHSTCMILERERHRRESEVVKVRTELEHTRLQNEVDRLVRSRTVEELPIVPSKAPTTRRLF